MIKKKINEKKLVSFFLRIGLATVFLYAGIGAFLNPTAWVGFIPLWLGKMIPVNTFLSIHAVFDITIGLWLMTGKKTFYASLVAGLVGMAWFTDKMFKPSNLLIIKLLFMVIVIIISLAYITKHLKGRKTEKVKKFKDYIKKKENKR